MRLSLLFTSLLFASLSVQAADRTVTINAISEAGIGKSLGTIHFIDSPDGLQIHPQLSGISAGEHGFHIHEKPSCEAAEKDGKIIAGQAAGAHYDPAKTGKHEGPMGQGHEGDLPVLTIAAEGAEQATLIAPRLKLADIVGHAVIIHEGPDNYSDTPKPLGGGGGRLACGVIE